jgi:limonene-1,2-epoxide hydrolase
MEPEAVATAFFERWSLSYDEMMASFEETFADNCRWDQRPMALTTTKAQALRFMARSRKMLGLETIDVDIMKIASSDDAVLCERVDHLRRKDGGLIVSAPVAGMLVIQDGLIVDWKEYFDSASILKAACVSGAESALSWLKGRLGR